YHDFYDPPSASVRSLSRQPRERKKGEIDATQVKDAARTDSLPEAVYLSVP
ncbi:hypothetical protein GWI33_011771, partial [Rhynchophorus ferrugineus]